MGGLAARLAARARDARVLTIDIERVPGVARAFDSRVEWIRPDMWVTPPRTVCFAARWYGDKTPLFSAEWAGDDLARASWALFDEADAVITYNGDKFDIPHLKAAWFETGLGPPRPFKSIDLIKSVRQFKFPSSSLDYVTRRLGRPGKVHKYDVAEAEAAVNGDEHAQKAFRRYNVGDVELTEWLHDRLLGWMPTHPHLGAPTDDKVCNQCGSDKLKLQATRYRAVVIDYALFRCDKCGANVRAGWHARAATTRGVK